MKGEGGLTDEVLLSARLSPAQAMAVAQFVKRVGRDDCNRLAGDQVEADAMFDGFLVLREALREAGFSPR